MKTQTRMIVASVVVIALALTAVSGITYSWFSDEETADVTISTGKIGIDLDVTSMKDQSNYGRAETTDLTKEYVFGVSAKAKVDTSTNAVTLSNLADNDSITIGMSVMNESTIATVYRISAVFGGDLSDYITATIKVGSTEVTDVTSWMKASPISGSSAEKLTDAHMTIKFNSNGAANGSSDNAKITLKAEAYQENCTDLPQYTVTKKVDSGATVSQKFSNGNSDVKSAGVSFKAASNGDYSISSITVPENSSYTIQRDGTTNEVLSGISVSAGAVNLSAQTAILTFTLGSNVISTAGLNEAISIIHQKSDGTTETVSLTASKGAGENLTANGDYRITDNSDGTFTLEVFVTGFSSYLVVADGDVYVSDSDGKKTYYKTLGNALNSSGINITLLRDISTESPIEINVSDLKLDLNGHTITGNLNDKAIFDVKKSLKICNGTLGNGNSRGINVNSITTPGEVTLSLMNVKIIGAERGISIGANSCKVTVNIVGGSVSAKYALNIVSGNADVSINAEGSTVSTGYCAVQTFSANTKLTFDDCKLIGENIYSGKGNNDFAIIVLNEEDASGSSVKLNNCEIIANERGTAKEYLLSIRCPSTVVAENCSFSYNNSPLKDIESLKSHIPKNYVNLNFEGDMSKLTITGVKAKA